MKFRDSRPQEASELELAPMIDVVFLLLIFFIVSWQFARFERDQAVNVPLADQTEQKDRKAGEIIINVRNDGSIYLSSEQVSPTALLERLQRTAREFPNQAVILRGDAGTHFGHIMTVLDQIKEAGIWNVAFATAKAQKTKE